VLYLNEAGRAPRMGYRVKKTQTLRCWGVEKVSEIPEKLPRWNEWRDLRY
jgi:hypothetical protein